MKNPAARLLSASGLLFYVLHGELLWRRPARMAVQRGGASWIGFDS
jgi:hypothetical protein